MNIIIADDSAIIRAILTQKLEVVENINILDSVSNGRKAYEKAKDSKSTTKPADIILMDIDMPEMDGFEATKCITSELNIPVILLSENKEDCLNAKKSGASDFFEKPSLDSYTVAFIDNLIKSIKKNAIKNSYFSDGGNASSWKDNSYKILCIGASTGGPSAVAEVLRGLGKNFKLPIIYSQHIDIGDDTNMSQWFNSECRNIRVKLVDDGEKALPGTVYMARADTHLTIDFVKSDGLPVLHINKEPPEHFLRPSVNVMFKSAASFYKSSCLAVLLTGMGRDGANGCKVILDNGGHTIVEDKSTCAVFGMPAAAIEIGGSSEVLPRYEIAKRILELVGE